MLNITNGGTVSNNYNNGYIGYNAGSAGTVTVDGSGSKWTNSSLYVGGGGYYSTGGSGTLKITNGATVSSTSSYIGYNSSSAGTVTVVGSGSKWTNSGFYVGNSGTGTLNITNGAAVSSGGCGVGSNSGSAGTVTVDGTGSMWSNSNNLFVGLQGTGTLNITNGGTVSGNSYGDYDYIGYNSGSAGTVTVDGTGSTWNTRYNAFALYVGCYGIGKLLITNGGNVISNCDSYIYIGCYSGSAGTVNVDGTSSTWTNGSCGFYVGYYGIGNLSITHGGTVSSSSSSVIGFNSGSAGTVTVDGAGSTWTTSGDLHVGWSGESLNITNGGAVSVAGTTYIASGTGSTSTINFGASGGTLTTRSLYASPTQLTGTGIIKTCGLVSDVNLVFDSTHGLSQTVPGFGNVAVNLNMSNPSNNGALGAGYQGAGTLTIQNGIAVASANGYLGYLLGSSGTATVDGAGSTWTNSGNLTIGSSGSGTLNITNGGSVSIAGTTYVASGTGSAGAINFGANGGTLTTQSLCASPTQLTTGTGTIIACGLVSDVQPGVRFHPWLESNSAGLWECCRKSEYEQSQQQRRPRRGLERRRFADHSKWNRGYIHQRLHRVPIRLDGHRNGLRFRLDVDQQRQPLRRLLRQRNAENHQRRRRQQYRRLYRLLQRLGHCDHRRKRLKVDQQQ